MKLKKFFSALILSLTLTLTLAEPISIITPGDTMSDLLARQLAPSSLVLQKSGGDGVIAYNALKNKEAQYTVATTTTLMIAPEANLNYSIKPTEEFRVVTVLASNSLMLVTKNGKFDSLDQVIRKNNVTLGGFGAVSVCAIVGKLLEQRYNIEVLYVPYKTSTQLASDVTGGFVDISCQTSDTLETFVASGRWTALANLGSSDLKLPRITNFPKVDIQFYLLTNTENTSDSLVQSMRKTRDNLPPTIYSIPLPFPKELERDFKRDKEFWKNGVKLLKQDSLK